MNPRRVACLLVYRLHDAMMTLLNSLSLNNTPSEPSITVSHGQITLTQRPVSHWANDSHHSHSLITRKLSSFKNPWPSFHKPTLLEMMRHSKRETEGDAVHEVDESDPVEVEQESLRVVQPTWGGPWNQRASNPQVSSSALDDHKNVRVTWLGHAGALVQFPPINPGDTTGFNVLFDPIFSSRAFPSQLAGPERVVPSPCKVSDLPPIHAVFLSHNQILDNPCPPSVPVDFIFKLKSYDHLDLTTINELWEREKDSIHFFAPLGNKNFFVSHGIPADQVTESDWWDEYDLELSSTPRDQEGTTAKNLSLTITCTPAQHNSGRWGMDSNSSLWCSWYFQSFEITNNQRNSGEKRKEPALRVYFGGDTGLRYRDPAKKDVEWDTCPAFEDIARRLGTPDLALLPISVGGTITYVKSLVPAPAGYSLVPEIPEALTSSTHMSPGDAVELHSILLGTSTTSARSKSVHAQENESDEPLPGRKRMISLAVHFGTFCSGEAESRDTVRTLRKECNNHGVRFIKREGAYATIGSDEESAFVVVDHGGTLSIDV